MKEIDKLENSHKYYDLDSFFRFFINEMKSKGGLLIYPELEELLMEYYKKLEKASTIRDLGNDQFFKKRINFPDNNYYISEWNIQKAIQTSKLYGKHIEKTLPIEALQRYNQAHLSVLDENRMENADLNNPIIVVYYSPNQELIIIDGNHRFQNAIQEKRLTINAYILYPNIYLDILSCDLCRTLYKIHNNLNIINYVVAGELKIDQDPMQAGLDPFYAIDEL